MTAPTTKGGRLSVLPLGGLERRGSYTLVRCNPTKEELGKLEDGQRLSLLDSKTGALLAAGVLQDADSNGVILREVGGNV